MTTRDSAVEEHGFEPPETGPRPASAPLPSSPPPSPPRLLAVVGPPGGGPDMMRRLIEAFGVANLVPEPGGGPAGLPDQILETLRATRSAPPELDPGGESSEPGPDRHQAAIEGLRAALDATEAGDPAADAPAAHGPAVWIDPANSLVLPHWRRRLDAPLAVVVAWQSPEATIAALRAEGISTVHALALWEAYIVHALRGCAGLPVLGLDLDKRLNRPDGTALVGLLAQLGITGPPDAAEQVAVALMEGAGDRPAPSGQGLRPPVGAGETALAAAVHERLGPALQSVAGMHPVWEPPPDLTIGPWAEAVLAGHRAAHRAASDAATAWAAVHEAQQVAADAKTAVEREHRGLVGPDPLHYLELRRELWRLRDEQAGIVAGRTHFQSAWLHADTARLLAEGCAADLTARCDELERVRTHLEDIRDQRDAMLVSEQWRVGRLVLGPFTGLRRLFSRR